MYYGARYYDPWVGRFLSQDPGLIGPEPGTSFKRLYGGSGEGAIFGSGGDVDPRNFNGYAYALNSPTRFNDSTGEVAQAVWGAGFGGVIQTAREISAGSFDGGVATKEGAKAIGRILVSAAVGAVTGGVSGAISKNVVGIGGKELAKTVATNATGNAAVGAAAAGAGQVAANTVEAGIDGGISGAGTAIADGSVLNGVGNAAVNGAAGGAAGSVLGDAFSAGVRASNLGGEAGTLSPGGTAAGVAISNGVGNVSPSDIPATDTVQHDKR